MEYTEIQKLIDSMGESKLTDLDIEFADGTKISMKKNLPTVANSASVAATTTTATDGFTTMPTFSDATTILASNVTLETKQETTNSNIVKSPMVGTFYSKSNPTADAFVLEGDKVVKGQTLCIIEAMKLMNEIESDYSGTIKNVLVKDGEMVEYGQPLFEIE